MRPVHPNIDLHPDDQQLMRLERHSYINLINVVHAELQLIERMIEAPGRLRECVRLAEYASRAFKDREVACEHVESFTLFGESIDRAVSSAVAESGTTGDSDDVREAVGILDSVLADAQCRLHEVLARHGVARPRCRMSVNEIEEHIDQNFEGGFSIHASRGEYDVPVGLSATLGRLLRALRESCSDFAERQTDVYTLAVEGEDSQTLAGRIRVEGPANLEAFDPLLSRMRPSELHEQIRAGASHLRGALELYYYSLPGGSLTLSSTGSAVRVECTLESTN